MFLVTVKSCMSKAILYSSVYTIKPDELPAFEVKICQL